MSVWVQKMLAPTLDLGEVTWWFSLAFLIWEMGTREAALQVRCRADEMGGPGTVPAPQHCYPQHLQQLPPGVGRGSPWRCGGREPARGNRSFQVTRGGFNR